MAYAVTWAHVIGGILVWVVVGTIVTFGSATLGARRAIRRGFVDVEAVRYIPEHMATRSRIYRWLASIEHGNYVSAGLAFVCTWPLWLRNYMLTYDAIIESSCDRRVGIHKTWWCTTCNTQSPSPLTREAAQMLGWKAHGLGAQIRCVNKQCARCPICVSRTPHNDLDWTDC